MLHPSTKNACPAGIDRLTLLDELLRCRVGGLIAQELGVQILIVCHSLLMLHRQPLDVYHVT